MPMCHANSLYFFGAFTYCGAACTIYSRKSFDPEHLVRTLADGGATFTSLVPTHYIMMLGLPAGVRARYNVDAVTKLMISSAPARRDTKLAIMEYFRNSGLFELYGSTEAGWVTMLHPEEQFSKLGSVGRECVGSRPIRLLDPAGNEVAARARRASFIRAIPTLSTATGSCLRRPRKRSGGTIARSAISPAATMTATSISSTARAT